MCKIFISNILSPFGKIKTIDTFGQGANSIPDKFPSFSISLAYSISRNI
ncbi:MAG: hypothetical protein ABI707_03620 [Ferruginibacter sp.]